MPLAKAATQKAMSAAAGRSWYLVELRNRSRDRFNNLGPLRGERELSRRLASCSCSRASYSFVISCSQASASGYCCPLWLCRRTKGKRPSDFLYLGLQLVKPGSRPNLLQSAALGSASYRSAKVCAAKVPRSFGNILGCLSQTCKLPALASTTAHGLKPSAESLASEVSLRSSSVVKRCSPDGRL